MWIDSHAHLVSDGLYEDFDELVDNAQRNNIEKILIICGNLMEIKRALKKTEGNTMFDLAIGVHPGSVSDISNHEFKEMMTYLNHPQVVAVGEIGLDYYWTEESKPLQLQRFKEQIELANTHDLPIIVHVRSSIEDTLKMLQANPVDKKGVIHCYSETDEILKTLVNKGYYIGFGGIVTFKNGGNVREALDVCPHDRMLSETDSPYLAPVPKRGKRNEPSFVMHTAQYMASYLNLKEDELSTIFKSNYYRLFKRSQR
ncbi:TatD family hydrolase [Erysipelothrix urinaevulpis]|uniref:TatD family hydrolase n=1 Tax=Erysipelothrix urinaevulpis TaxID=2683717 RepID=UPI00135A0417|nr:TatD family hydrolase [Erysipelothrix urinaevulpis]